MKCPIALATALTLVACSPSTLSKPQTVAEPLPAADNLALVNGTIYTVDDDQPWAEALIIENGTITFVGTDADAARYITAEMTVVDLDGYFVMPGIHDVHTHPLEAFDDSIAVCELENGIPVEAQLPTITDCAEANPDAPWVMGWGHGIDDILDTEIAPAQLLDQVVPDRPALFMEFTSHSLWANSKALEMAGFTAGSPNPPGGIIVKDPTTGEPTGLLIDNAGNIVRELAYRNPSAAQLDATYAGLLIGLEELARHGITSIADARVYWRRRHHEVWQRATAENRLTARVVLGLWAAPELGDDQIKTLKSLYDNDPDSLLRITQIKLYSDGIVDLTTAALKEPYALTYDFTVGNGLNYFTEARLIEFITALEPVGFDFHIHAIGDRGIHEALNAIAATQDVNGTGGRHRLTHLEVIDRADMPRFAALGVIADFQVAGEWSDPHRYETYTRELIGERSHNAIPINSLYETGATVTLSSDFDVSEMNPFVGMEHALTRSREALPNLDAVIRAYTINGAYALRQEETVGSLEVGKFADLIVLDQNLFEIAPEDIDQTTVLWTLLAGSEVYRDPSF